VAGNGGEDARKNGDFMVISWSFMVMSWDLMVVSLEMDEVELTRSDGI
jgi:hypothetical protein